MKVKELCKCTGITKTHTTPGHPQGNGTTERFNRTLMNMLGTLEPHLKPRWHEHVDTMTHAYNRSRHDSTGFSPYYLMFGRHPRLPVDLIFGSSTTSEPCEYSEYVQTLHDCLSQAYAQANETSRHSKEQQKKYYDKKAKCQAFSPGDRVLIKVCHVEGRQKLGDRWEARPYIVVKKRHNSPVYVVRPEDGGKERVVHRNLLAQCMFLPVEQVGGAAVEGNMFGAKKGMAGLELDTEADSEVDGTEECVDEAGAMSEVDGPSSTVEAVDTAVTEEIGGVGTDVAAKPVSEKAVAADRSSVPQRPGTPRINPPRNRCPPKTLSYESQAMKIEDNQQKIKRGCKLWGRAKAKRAAGHL